MKTNIFTKSLAFTIILFCIGTTVSAQMTQKIGGNPFYMEPSAVLELESTTKGFLLPRMTEAQMNAITSPPAGMMVYCTDCGSGELRVKYSTSWGIPALNLSGDVNATVNASGSNVTTIQPNKVLSSMILDGTIVNADVDAAAAIAGTKIAPNFGSQNVVTTGTLGAGATSLSTLSTSGAATLSSAAITNNATVGGTLGVTGAATLSSTLGVTGVATFTAKPIVSTLTASQAVFTDGSKGLVSNAITGTGNVVMSTSPILVTPILGTPTSVTLTNATGLPISGISGLGTGVSTFLATPSSANLASAMTDETGSGASVFATSPTLVTPVLGAATATSVNGTTIPSSKTLVVTTDKLSALSATTSTELAGVISDESGSGAAVFATSPTLVTPVLGAATATSVNGTTIPSSKTLVVTTDKLSALSATTSAELAGVISDETGSGVAVFATSPTLVTPVLGVASATTITTTNLIAGTNTYPTTQGTTGQVLMTNGTGTLSWGTPAPSVIEVADEFTATAAQTSFTLTQTPSVNSKVKMYINGIRISKTAYTVSGTTLTYIPANNGSYVLSASDRIQFDYFK